MIPIVSDQIKKIPGKRGRKKKTNELDYIRYPRFSFLASIEQNDFWREKIEAMAYNSLPEHISITNEGRNIIYLKSSRSYEQEIPINDLEAIDFIKNIFRKYGNIINVLEDIIEEDNIIPSTWVKVKKNNKETLLKSFVENQRVCIKNMYNINLNNIQVDNMYTVITIGININCFNKNNIILNNGMIDKIDGLLFEHNMIVFYIDEVLYKGKGKEINYTANDLLNDNNNILDSMLKTPDVDKIYNNLYAKKGKTTHQTPSTSMYIQSSVVSTPS